MAERLHDTQFVDVMQKLRKGDVIVRRRAGREEMAVVRGVGVDDEGEKRMMLSRFSRTMTAVMWPWRVDIDGDMLVDERGAVLLMSDEFVRVDEQHASAVVVALDSKIHEIKKLYAPHNLFDVVPRILHVLSDTEPTDEEAYLFHCMLVYIANTFARPQAILLPLPDEREYVKVGGTSVMFAALEDKRLDILEMLYSSHDVYVVAARIWRILRGMDPTEEEVCLLHFVFAHVEYVAEHE